MAAVLAVCCVRCGPCRLLCGEGLPCGGKHIIIIIISSGVVHTHIYIYIYIYICIFVCVCVAGGSLEHYEARCAFDAVHLGVRNEGSENDSVKS